jgi:hypothetical protein
MVNRKKNLLEVLQPTSSQTPRTPSSPSSSSTEIPIGAFSARARPRLASNKTMQLALLVFVVAVGAAYWLGRQHSSGVIAAPSAADEGVKPGALVRPTQTAAPVTPPVDVAAANLQTAQSGSTDDQSFMNPVNRYTIRLIQFSDDATGRSAANALYEHLRKKEAVPVISPISKGKALILVAGAAPKVKDLDGLLALVRGLHGPNSQESLPFKDAYPVNIDDLVERRR